jgi:hypothetical protein
MGLAPFGDLDGVHPLVLWALNEVHLAIPAHEVTGQPERVFFRGAREWLGGAGLKKSIFLEALNSEVIYNT